MQHNDHTMTTEERKAVLIKHKDLIEMVHFDRYFAGNELQSVVELNDLHKDIYGSYQLLNCGPCIQELFDTMYNDLQKVI